MEVIYQALAFIAVSFLWGATNPLIKRGGKGIECIKKESKLKQFIYELWFLISKIEYIIPFLINQSGSVLYYITLASADLSLAVPITNSLTFIWTGISGKFFGENFGNAGTYLGVAYVIFGITLCVISKVL